MVKITDSLLTSYAHFEFFKKLPVRNYKISETIK